MIYETYTPNTNVERKSILTYYYSLNLLLTSHININVHIIRVIQTFNVQTKTRFNMKKFIKYNCTDINQKCNKF